MSSNHAWTKGNTNAGRGEENWQLDIIDYTQYRKRQRLAEAKRKLEADAWENWCYLRGYIW